MKDIVWHKYPDEKPPKTVRRMSKWYKTKLTDGRISKSEWDGIGCEGEFMQDVINREVTENPARVEFWSELDERGNIRLQAKSCKRLIINGISKN